MLTQLSQVVPASTAEEITAEKTVRKIQLRAINAVKEVICKSFVIRTRHNLETTEEMTENLMIVSIINLKATNESTEGHQNSNI